MNAVLFVPAALIPFVLLVPFYILVSAYFTDVLLIRTSSGYLHFLNLLVN